MSITTDMSGPTDRDDTEELPPAARRVLKALREADGPMTTGELVDETLHQQRTVREAATRLRTEGLVQSRWGSEDARQRVHTITGGDTDGE